MLPKYERPPVVEAAMAIEFAPVPGLDFFKLTRLQSKWEDRYPDITEVPGAPPTPTESDNQIAFALSINGAGPRRIWAAGRDSGLLVQSQDDRLILNWRKAPSPGEYPGYFESLRDEFSRLWGILTAFLAETGLPAPIPLLAEYNYVNAVPLDPDDAMEDVVTIVRIPEQELPGENRFTQFQMVRDVKQSDTDPYTTHIQIMGEPQRALDGSRQAVFTVVARALLGAKSDNPFDGLDAAHALASNTFARIVADEKQEQWGRIK